MFARQGDGLVHRTPMPNIRRPIGFAMRKKRIQRPAELFALPRHDIDRIMEQRAADFRGRFAHEHARFWLPPHQHRQRADVVLMRMRNEYRIERSIRD